VADNWLRSINLHKNIVFVLLSPKRYEAHGSLRLSLPEAVSLTDTASGNESHYTIVQIHYAR
jgi:hypothetical protein